MVKIEQTEEMKDIIENNPRVTILASFPEQFEGSRKIHGYAIDETPDTITIRLSPELPSFIDKPILGDSEYELIKANIGGIRRYK